jgi:hypothetical protein
MIATVSPDLISRLIPFSIASSPSAMGTRLQRLFAVIMHAPVLLALRATALLGLSLALAGARACLRDRSPASRLHRRPRQRQRAGMLVLGDSISAAYGMSLEEGWVALLEQRLRERWPDASVINAEHQRRHLRRWPPAPAGDCCRNTSRTCWSSSSAVTTACAAIPGLATARKPDAHGRGSPKRPRAPRTHTAHGDSAELRRRATRRAFRAPFPDAAATSGASSGPFPSPTWPRTPHSCRRRHPPDRRGAGRGSWQRRPARGHGPAGAALGGRYTVSRRDQTPAAGGCSRHCLRHRHPGREVVRHPADHVILISVGVMMLDSMPAFHAAARDTLQRIEWAFTACSPRSTCCASGSPTTGAPTC